MFIHLNLIRERYFVLKMYIETPNFISISNFIWISNFTEQFQISAPNLKSHEHHALAPHHTTSNHSRASRTTRFQSLLISVPCCLMISSVLMK